MSQQATILPLRTRQTRIQDQVAAREAPREGGQGGEGGKEGARRQAARARPVVEVGGVCVLRGWDFGSGWVRGLGV